MERTTESGNVFRFGLFEANCGENSLMRDGIRVKIQDQPFQLLILLLRRPGEVVTREELRQSLWPEGTYVDFDGSLNVIFKRLRATLGDDPENPRFIQTVPRRGYRFIAPVSVEKPPESDPEQITPDVPLTVESLPSVSQALPTTVLPASNHERRPLYLYGIFAFAIVLIGTGLAWRSGRLGNNPSLSSTRMRKSVAVLGFRNLSGQGEDAWLTAALSEMLSTELSAGEKLRLVSGEEVANLRASAPWPSADSLDRDTSVRIGHALNSDVLVLGSYMRVGKTDQAQLRLDVRMQDGKTGEILAETAQVGNGQDLFRLISRVGSELRGRLGLEQLQGSEEAEVLAASPLDPEAARFYALGLTKLRQFDALAAKDLLEQAAEIDPKFSLVHVMLARAWAELGYAQANQEEAKRAFDLSVDLPRAQRLLVEGEYYESLGNHEKATSAYRALFELFPDNVDYGLRLASAQRLAGHKSEGLATIARLRKLPPPASDDPKIDLVEARLVLLKSDALRLIRAALGKTSRENEKLLFAQGKHDECITLVYGEHAQDADAPCKEAYDGFMSAGNRLAAADTLRLIADRQNAEGDTDEALKTYGRAVDMLSSLGDHDKTGAVLNNMGSALMNQGKLAMAEPLFKQAQSHFEQAGDRTNALVPLSNIADILYLRGQLSSASRAYQQALQLAQGLDRPDIGYSLYRLADVQLTQGDLKEAHKNAEKAVGLLQSEVGEPLSSALIISGEVSRAEGDFAAAQKTFNRSLQIRQTLGTMTLVAQTETELAELTLLQGDAPQAENQVRKAIEQFEKEHSEMDLASGYVLLSQALLKQDRVSESRAAVGQALVLTGKSAIPALKMSAAIQAARVDLADSSKHAKNSAGAELLSQISAAKRLGYYNLECEARIPLGELELKANPSVGRKQLNDLVSDTRSHGYELYARQAEDVLNSGTVVAVNGAKR